MNQSLSLVVKTFFSICSVVISDIFSKVWSFRCCCVYLLFELLKKFFITFGLDIVWALMRIVLWPILNSLDSRNSSFVFWYLLELSIKMSCWSSSMDASFCNWFVGISLIRLLFMEIGDVWSGRDLFLFWRLLASRLLNWVMKRSNFWVLCCSFFLI